MIPSDITILYDQLFDFVNDQLPESPDIVKAVRAVQEITKNTDLAYKALLPLLVCGAIGNDPEAAVPLAAAWFLYDQASNIFDDVQDQDGKTYLPWNNWPPAQAINVGLGMIGIGNICLSKLDTSPDALSAILASWGHTLAIAAKGQNHHKNLSLKQYFNQTVAKSGLVFASVTWAGARLQQNDNRLLSAMFDYGMGVGMMIQIRDDCHDITAGKLTSDLKAHVYTLPLLYALSLEKDPRHAELCALIELPMTTSNINTICSLLEYMNAWSYSASVMGLYEQKSLAALQAACYEPYRSHLKNYVSKLSVSLN